MSTLDEITRRSSGSARRSLASMHSARSSRASSASWKRPSACWRVTAKAPRPEGRVRPRRPPRPRRPLQPSRVVDRAAPPQNQLLVERPRRASAIRFLPWQTARHSRKSPLHATGFAPTMSASPSPGTNEPAASKSATGSSMRRNRRSKPNPLRPNTGTKNNDRLVPAIRHTVDGDRATHHALALIGGRGLCQLDPGHLEAHKASIYLTLLNPMSG